MKITRLNPLFLTLLFPAGVLHSQQGIYPVRDLDSTMRTADAVVRFDSTVLEIKGKQRAFYTEEKIITILSPAEEKMANIFDYYSDCSTITSFKAWVMDANGKVVKKFSKGDASDYSASGEYVNDYRVKVWNMNIIKLPFTIHYVIEESYSSTYNLPDWRPVTGENIGANLLKYRLIYDESTPVNYRAYHIHKTDSTANVVTWQINNFYPVKREEFGPPFHDLAPRIMVMSKNYKLFKYEGTAKTWSDIGKFFTDLNGEGRDQLQEVTDPAAKAIINSDADKLTKTKELFKYLQDNYRYVFVGIDIAGWQAQTADFTMGKKYGDCKALAIEMKALLQKSGIESFPVLIYGGRGEQGIVLDKDFPHSPFNHVILCIPMQPDTVWLDCTSSIDPFNYLGSFTANRDALLTFDGGGRLIHTPVYNEKYNISRSATDIHCNDNNTSIIQTNLEKEGELQEALRWDINRHEEKNLESSILASAHLVNTKMLSYKIINMDSTLPKVSLSLELTNQNTIKKTASRIFVHTDILKPIGSIPENKKGRTQQIHAGRGFTQFDTLVYHLPPGYQPENFKPTGKENVSTRFGDVTCETVFEDVSNEIKIYRSFCLRQGTYPAEDFPDFRDFLLKGTKTFCPELVLKKKD